jgi:flagellar hook-length control protein FliK
MSANQGQEIEISLNPEELGRVRIVLSTKEGGMNVMVFSDKPDVLDLMRRHSDQLEMDFTDIGYQGASFTFQQEQEGNQSPPELPGIETPRDIAPSQQEYETVDDGRLDLRL